MDIRKTRTCEKCKSVITLDKVRIMPKDKENNWLVCDNCCKTLKENIVKAQPQRHVITNQFEEKNILTKNNLKSQSPHQVITNKFEERKMLSCARCNYSFKIDAFKAGTTHRVFCPYCGRADRIENYDKNQKNDHTNATVTKTISPLSKSYK